MFERLQKTSICLFYVIIVFQNDTTPFLSSYFLSLQVIYLRDSRSERIVTFMTHTKICENSSRGIENNLRGEIYESPDRTERNQNGHFTSPEVCWLSGNGEVVF